MKQFNTVEEAKEYGEIFSKHQWEKVMVGSKEIILCGTDMAYEEEVWSDVYELLKSFVDKFGYSEDEIADDIVDKTSELRDEILEWFEKKTNTQFVDVCDEY